MVKKLGIILNIAVLFLLIIGLTACKEDPFKDEYINAMMDRLVRYTSKDDLKVEEMTIYYYETEVDRKFFYEITYDDGDGSITLIYTYNLYLFDSVFTHYNGENIPEFSINYNLYKEAVAKGDKKEVSLTELNEMINEAFERKELKV